MLFASRSPSCDAAAARAFTTLLLGGNVRPFSANTGGYKRLGPARFRLLLELFESGFCIDLLLLLAVEIPRRLLRIGGALFLLILIVSPQVWISSRDRHVKSCKSCVYKFVL